MKKSMIAIAAIFSLIACEKEIKLSESESNPRIVVNSTFQAGDTIKLNISESRNILFEESLPRITNATAKLSDVNGTEIGTFTHTMNGQYYLSSFFPEVGKTYKIDITAPGLDPISATTTCPSLISGATIDTTTNGITDQRIQFTLNFSDDVNQENYYGISITRIGLFEMDGEEVYNYASPYFSTREVYVLNGSSDIDGEKYGQEFFFSDKTFNGQNISFEGLQGYSTAPGESSYYIVGIRSLSEDLFKYKLSFSKYQDAQDSPFAEPVQVYSNITDGFGIFGGSSSYTDTIFVD